MASCIEIEHIAVALGRVGEPDVARQSDRVTRRVGAAKIRRRPHRRRDILC